MKKGFTLIELLVVVGIVFAIGMVVVGAANNPQTTNNVQQIQANVLPEATGYVVDNAGILKEETKQQLEAKLKALDPIAQVAVVTIKTYSPYADEKEYAIKLAEKWKPGYKGKDNGIIFLIVTEDRKVRIEVGRGLEGVINDAKAGRILDSTVVPFLKKNDWDGGILSGVDAISKEVSK